MFISLTPAKSTPGRSDFLECGAADFPRPGSVHVDIGVVVLQAGNFDQAPGCAWVGSNADVEAGNVNIMNSRFAMLAPSLACKPHRQRLCEPSLPCR